MANLLASLSSLSSGLRAFEQSLGTSQNNVGNAATPGYARQSTIMTALPFDGAGGLIGGVASGGIQSARDRFAELAVERQTSNLGQFKEAASLLNSLNQILELSGDSSVPAGFNQLLQSFSAWSVAPQSAAARQQVVAQADQFANSVRFAASQIQNMAAESEHRLGDVTNQINTLGQRIAAINSQRTGRPASDSALETDLYRTLDELSSLTNFTVLAGENGQMNVLLGGQTPLAIGGKSFAITGALAPPPDANSVGGVPEWRFLDANGQNITGQFSAGKVRALLDLRNNTLPGLIGGQGQIGSLNAFATAVAERINGLLTAGQVSTGTPPVGGVPLFSFASVNPAQAASSFRINQTLSKSELAAGLAATQTGPPTVANGVALELAGLQLSNSPLNQINGVGFLAFYGGIAADIGSGAQTASDWEDRSSSLLNQAKAMRQDASGVSLDEEAARIVELQRGYQAISRVVSVIDQMTDSLMAMIR